MKPKEEMAGVLRFLAEPWEAQVAEFDGQPDYFDRVRQATGIERRTLWRVDDPLTTVRVGVWKRVVPAEKWSVWRELAQRGEGQLVDELTFESSTVV